MISAIPCIITAPLPIPKAIGTMDRIVVSVVIKIESPRFSAMVMMSIPFALIGSFGLLYLTGSTLSMVSLMGVLMLVGIVVNNGILYVDTVNQLREEIPLEEALVKSGQMR